MAETKAKFDPTLVEFPKAKAKADKPPKDDPDFIPKPADSALTGVKSKGRRPADIVAIENGLEMMFGMLGMGLSMVNMYDAQVITMNAELLAAHWTKVAEQNPKVKKWLLGAMQGGTWITAISATGAVLVPIAVNHDAAPENMLAMSRQLGVKLPSPLPPAELNAEVHSNGNGSTS